MFGADLGSLGACCPSCRSTRLAHAYGEAAGLGAGGAFGRRIGPGVLRGFRSFWLGILELGILESGCFGFWNFGPNCRFGEHRSTKTEPPVYA